MAGSCRRGSTRPHAVQHAPEPDALNTGLLADGLRLIDVDVDDAVVAGRVKALALALLGDAPIRWRANSGRVLLPYRAAEGEPGKLVVAGTTGKLEVLGKGQQAVVDGLHPSGAVLQWEPDPPGAFTRDGLVAVTEAQVGAFLAAAAPLIGAEQAPPAGPSTLGQLLRAPVRARAWRRSARRGGGANGDPERGTGQLGVLEQGRAGDPCRDRRQHVGLRGLVRVVRAASAARFSRVHGALAALHHQPAHPERRRHAVPPGAGGATGLAQAE